jgi:hypothetical protein
MNDGGGSRLSQFLGWLVAFLAMVPLFPFGANPASGPPPAASSPDTGTTAASQPKDDSKPKKDTLDEFDEIIRQAIEMRSKDGDTSAPKQPFPEKQGEIKIDSMIVCVADPVTSAVGFRFDLQLDDLQKALGSHDYVLTQWKLPWKNNQSAKGEPGLFVFRKVTREGKNRHEVMVVYLVAEWITTGLDREAFHRALSHINRLGKWTRQQEPGSSGGELKLPILGPVFTGSVDSLGEVLQDSPDWRQITPVIFNFSALAVDLQRLQTISGRGDKLLYGETVIGTDAMWKGISAYLSTIYHRPPKVAWLSETGTEIGVRKASKPEQTPDSIDRVFYYFPTGIARVRSAYATVTKEDGKQRLPVGTTDGLILHFPMQEPKNPHDSPPRYDPGIQSPYAELILRQILFDIDRNEFDVVGITATDHRDRIFLAQQIRRYAPHVQLVQMVGDLAYEHPDYRQSLRGTIVASTYPMFPFNQQWSSGPDSAETGGSPRRRYAFSSQTGYALFNAVSCARVVAGERGEFDEQATLTVNDPSIPFLEYRFPHDKRLGRKADESSQPPLWISVLGDQGVWPVAIDDKSGEVSKNLIKLSFKAQRKAALDKNGEKETNATQHDTHDTHPISLKVVLILQIVAAFMAYWATGGFLPPNLDPAQTRSRVTWVRPMREWWSKSDAEMVAHATSEDSECVCPTADSEYVSAKARRLFTPMLLGLAALWLQVLVCGMHQWALFAFDAQVCNPTPANSIPLVRELVLFAVAGTILLYPLPLSARSFLGAATVAVASVLLHRASESAAMLFFAMMATLAGMLLLRAIARAITRRLWPDRTQAISPFVESVIAVTVLILNTALLAYIVLEVRKGSISLPWLTTGSWVFNGVSPLLPVIAACVAIEVMARSQLMRRWLIETSFVSTTAAGGQDRLTSAQMIGEQNDLSYPLSGEEFMALVRQSLERLRDGLLWLLGLRGAPPVGSVIPRSTLPYAYLISVGFGLFSVWLLYLLTQVRPIYPIPSVNLIISGVILGGFLTWAVIFCQLLALRFRFFRQLRAFHREIGPPTSLFADAFVATRRPQDEWLGRLLYSRPSDLEQDESAIQSAIATEGSAASDLASALVRQYTIDVARWIPVHDSETASPVKAEDPQAKARKRVIGIKRWVAFVGAQLRTLAFGLGAAAFLLYVAISSLPFQPRPWFQLTSTLTFVAIGIEVVTTMIAVEANEVMSLIAGTPPGKVSVDWSLILKLAPWVIVPVAMVIGQSFPELWNWCGAALESLRTP